MCQNYYKNLNVLELNNKSVKSAIPERCKKTENIENNICFENILIALIFSFLLSDG